MDEKTLAALEETIREAAYEPVLQNHDEYAEGFDAGYQAFARSLLRMFFDK